MSSYMKAIVMFALSLTIYEIFFKQLKCQKFDPENVGQDVGGENLRHSTENVRFIIGDFFQNFSYLGIYFYAKFGNILVCKRTRTQQTRMHTQQETEVITIGSLPSRFA